MISKTAIRSLNLLMAVGLLLGGVASVAQNVQRNPHVTHAARHDVSLPLREMARNAPPPAPGKIEMREHVSPRHIFTKTTGPDPAIQHEFLPGVSTTNLLSFDAIDGNDAGAIPPDTNGSIGSTQYVLITNFDYAVYDKTNGHQILAPTQIGRAHV